MKFSKISMVAILITVLLVMAAVPVFAKSPGDYKMVLLLPGSIDDQSWNAANYAGLVACNEDLGTNIEYVENVQPADFESTMRNYAQRGYDMVMAAGTQFDEAAKNISQQYPETTFSVVNGMIAAKPNLKPVLPKEYEASFLAGIIAGHTTESGKIGLVGGFPNKLMIRLLNTYEWGARTVVPDLTAKRSYANSWSDVSLGKQMASSMIDDGVDVLFFYANEVGLGAIQAAEEEGIKYVGFADNQNDVAPGTVVASVYFEFTGLYKWMVNSFLNDRLQPKVNEVGIAEDIVKVVYTDEVSEEVKEAVSRAEEAIANNNFMKYMTEFPEPLE